MENKIYATILILITVYLGICVASYGHKTLEASLSDNIN